VAEYRRGLAGFFAESLRDGLRVAYVGSDGAGAARADLADLSDPDRLLAAGALQVLSARDVYGAGGPVDPERVVAFVAAATEQALVDGFRGLAMSGDATELVRTPAKRDAFARYEFLVDRYMASHPLSALCGYGLELGNDTVTEFAMLHAPGPSNATPYQVFACPDGAIGLGGEFDPVGVAALGRVLPRLRTTDGESLVVDMAGVDYVDHRLLLTLDRYARGHGIAVSLRSAPPLAARLVELLPVFSLQRAGPGAQGSGAQG
jgi:anti-anti-sigma regulatory factor